MSSTELNSNAMCDASDLSNLSDHAKAIIIEAAIIHHIDKLTANLLLRTNRRIMIKNRLPTIVAMILCVKANGTYLSFLHQQAVPKYP